MARSHGTVTQERNTKPANTPSKRNKTLHRFYEPLVLLYVLNNVQGNHLPRQRNEALSPNVARRSDLRRRFLDSLAYICDSEKGGDTVTAVFVSSSPLVYHVSCNKPQLLDTKIIPFVKDILGQLAAFDNDEETIARRILSQCISFSIGRLSTYRRFLGIALKRCREVPTEDNALAKGQY
jgi:hypothetical protein